MTDLTEPAPASLIRLWDGIWPRGLELVKKAILTVIMLCSLLSSNLMVIGGPASPRQSGPEDLEPNASPTIALEDIPLQASRPLGPPPPRAQDDALSWGPAEPYCDWPEEGLTPLSLKPLEPGPGDIVIRGHEVWEDQVRVVSSNTVSYTHLTLPTTERV